MAEKGTLTERARAAVARMQIYEGDLARRENALAGKAEEYSHREAKQIELAHRLEEVRVGLRAEAKRLKTQRDQQDGFETDLEYFLDRLGASTRLEGENLFDYARRAAAEVLQRKEIEGQQARISYGRQGSVVPAVLEDAVRESFESEPEPKEDVPVLRVKRKFSPQNLGPDGVRINYAQDEILLTVDVKEQSDLSYYERAFGIVTVPFAYSEIDAQSGRVLISGKPDAVENLFRQVETRIGHERATSEINDALRKLG